MYQYPFKGTYRETCSFKTIGSWSAGYHIGVDLVGSDKNIYPICKGKVQSINSKGSAYGNHVLIEQNDGRVSLYAHLSVINVSVGQEVSLSTCIGVEGSTGNSTGSHLHLELHEGAYKYPSSTDAPWLLDPLKTIAYEISSYNAYIESLNAPSDWAKEATEWVKETGISDGTRPRENVTREEVFTMLYRFNKGGV